MVNKDTGTDSTDAVQSKPKRPHPRKGRNAQNTSYGTRPVDIERWERDYECVQMRRNEQDWQAIVEKLGYASPGHAHDRFMAFMKQYPRDDVEAMRDLELDRLEKTCRALQSRVEQGDPRACEVWNKLSERRAKLMGLDKPERKELTVLTEDVVDKAIREATEAMERATHAAKASGIEVSTLEN